MGSGVTLPLWSPTKDDVGVSRRHPRFLKADGTPGSFRLRFRSKSVTAGVEAN